MNAEPAQLVLATANPKKVAELRRMLDGRYRIEPRPADLAETVEDGETLEANALKKAREVCRRVGAAAVADDTGLFVGALGGRPGVRTARYAGPEADDDANVTLLLHELAGGTGVDVDGGGREARFRTVIAVVWPDGREVVVEGAVEGTITTERRGTDGFGYDPVFVPVEGDGRTFAEMTGDEKNAISHRGRAVAALVEVL